MTGTAPVGPFHCTFCMRPAEFFAPHPDGRGHVRVCAGHGRALPGRKDPG